MNVITHSPFRYILGSKSPRRQELLKQLGLDFEVRVSDVNETYPLDLKIDKVAVYLAQLKGNWYRDKIKKDELVITADTVVILGDEILEKPSGKQQALDMIRKLSGKTHRVMTGVALTTASSQHCFSETTMVSFKELDESEIEYYVDKYKPYDKAGAYGIQEWIGLVAVRSIEGCFFNVIGLPVPRLYRELHAFTND
jgi:septum formation protein